MNKPEILQQNMAHSAEKIWDELLEQEVTKNGISNLLQFRQGIARSLDIESALPEECYPVRPPVFTNAVYETIQGILIQVAELCERSGHQITEGNPNLLSETLNGTPCRPRSFASAHPLAQSLAALEIRPDFIFHRGQLKVLELNFGAITGGMPEVSAQTFKYLDHDIAHRVMQSESLFGDSPIARRAAYVERLTRELRLNRRARIVAIVDADTRYLKIANTFAMLMAAHGIHVDIASHEEIQVKNGYASLDSKCFDIAITAFSEDPDRYGDPEYLRAYEEICFRGKTLVIGGERCFSYGSKSIFAYLHDKLNKNVFSQDEEDLIQRYIPWTAALTDDVITFKGEDIALRKDGVKDRFVIKLSRGFGGKGVMIGCNATQDEWNDFLNQALASHTSVIQEFFTPDAIDLPFIDTPNKRLVSSPCIAVHSLFMIDRKPGGLYTRFSRSGGSYLVNLQSGGSIPALVSL